MFRPDFVVVTYVSFGLISFKDISNKSKSLTPAEFLIEANVDLLIWQKGILREND